MSGKKNQLYQVWQYNNTKEYMMQKFTTKEEAVKFKDELNVNNFRFGWTEWNFEVREGKDE